MVARWRTRSPRVKLPALGFHSRRAGGIQVTTRRVRPRKLSQYSRNWATERISIADSLHGPAWSRPCTIMRAPFRAPVVAPFTLAKNQIDAFSLDRHPDRPGKGSAGPLPVDHRRWGPDRGRRYHGHGFFP